MKLDAFLADLGSSKGAPGGGAAAALTGATGAALIEMVARLNDKRLNKTSGTVKKAEALRKAFQKLIVQDAKAFELIQKAYKLRQEKPAVWQKALRNGVKPPVEIARLAREGWLLIQKERPRTSKWLISDLMESFLFLDVVYGSAILNADANLKSINDNVFCISIEKKLKSYEIHRELWQ